MHRAIHVLGISVGAAVRVESSGNCFTRQRRHIHGQLRCGDKQGADWIAFYFASKFCLILFNCYPSMVFHFCGASCDRKVVLLFFTGADQSQQLLVFVFASILLHLLTHALTGVHSRRVKKMNKIMSSRPFKPQCTRLVFLSTP